MFAILVCSMIMIVVTLGAENMTFSLFLEKFVTNLTLAFVILIVVIPEGIPMTIGISIAYSVFDMYDNDHLLVRNLNAPEKLGLVNEILIGKTGTMTTEEMDVVSFYI
jgi:Ca2+-transporting ATPase